jgi:MFS family permease
MAWGIIAQRDDRKHNYALRAMALGGTLVGMSTTATATAATTPQAPAALPPAAPTGSRRHGIGFWAIAFAFLTVLAYSAVPTPLYPLYQARDGFSSLTITVVFAAYAVGVVASLFAVGHLSDWYGRRRLAVPAILASLLSALIFLLWRDLPGLILARVITGFGVGAVTATATAWIGELHAAHRPGASPERAQAVATLANLGGIGVGPLVAGVLAAWVPAPLTVPYLVFIAALLVGLAFVLLTPETRERLQPLPAYRPQRVSVPERSRGRYFAAGVAAAIAFAAFGVFTSLAPTFLAVTLHHNSPALAGATAFAVFAAGAVTQVLAGKRSAAEVSIGGSAGMLAGLALLVVAVWLAQPSLALFLLGAVVLGAGAGALFRGAVATVGVLAPPERRAEALAGMFLAGYIGLSLPVVGLGLLTQDLSSRVSLLIFAVVLGAAALAATPFVARRRDAGLA